MLTPARITERLEKTTVAELAARARVDTKTTAALLDWLPRLAADAAWEDFAFDISGRLMNSPVGPALSELGSPPVEAALGSDITLFYLLVALLEIPAAEARHQRCGIDPSISRATWADVAVWCRQLRRRDGRAGITLEMLAWLQRGLNGSLFRVGSLQFEMDTFSGPVRAYRNRVSGELALVAEPGVLFNESGRMIASVFEPGAWIAGGTLQPDRVHGHRIDGIDGRAHHDTLTLSLETWELALCEGDSMIRAHIPANAKVSVPDFYRSASQAVDFFAKILPDAPPSKGFFGEGWLFDPQVSQLLPNSSAVDDLRAILCLYPGRISELNTLQRIFGVSATRDSILTLPRDGMSGFQRSVADFLATPGNRLSARGGFILNEHVSRLEAAK